MAGALAVSGTGTMDPAPLASWQRARVDTWAAVSAVRTGARGSSSGLRGSRRVPHEEHRARASNSDVAVAWLAVVPFGAALLAALVG
jgi:hypothetical protein